MPKSGSHPGKSASQMIDGRIEELDDWRGAMLGRLRAVVRQADPGVVEEWKWNVVKLTFAHGAALEDPSGLFNSSLEGKTRRAIDFRQDETIDEKALKALIREAAALNASRAGG